MPSGLKFVFKCDVTGYRRSCLELEQLEDVLLEGSGFGQLLEVDRGLVFASPAGVPWPGTGSCVMMGAAGYPAEGGLDGH